MSDIKTPWYPVPPCRGAKGWESDPHVLNRDGEPVGVFEMLADAEAAANAVNERAANERADTQRQRREDEMRDQCEGVIKRLARSGRHCLALGEAYQPDVRAMEHQLHGIRLLCDAVGWQGLASKAASYSSELNDARFRMIGDTGARHE